MAKLLHRSVEAVFIVAAGRFEIAVSVSPMSSVQTVTHESVCTADAFVEFAMQRSAVSTCLHTHADSTKAYAHAAGSHLVGRSNIPLSCGPRTTCRFTPHKTSPVVPRPTFPLQLSLEAISPNSQRREPSCTRTTPPVAAASLTRSGHLLALQRRRSPVGLLHFVSRMRQP